MPILEPTTAQMAGQQHIAPQTSPLQQKPQGVLGFVVISWIFSYCCARGMDVSSPSRTALISLAGTTGVTILGSLATLESANRWKWSTSTLRWMMGGLTTTTHLCSLIALLGPSVFLKCHLLLTFACVSTGRVAYELFALRADPPRPPLPAPLTPYLPFAATTPYDELVEPFLKAMKRAHQELIQLTEDPTIPSPTLYYSTILLAGYYLFTDPSVVIQCEKTEPNKATLIKDVRRIVIDDPAFEKHITALNENIAKLHHPFNKQSLRIFTPIDEKAIHLLILMLTDAAEDQIQSATALLEAEIRDEKVKTILAVRNCIVALREPFFTSKIIPKSTRFGQIFSAHA